MQTRLTNHISRYSSRGELKRIYSALLVEPESQHIYVGNLICCCGIPGVDHEVLRWLGISLRYLHALSVISMTVVLSSIGVVDLSDGVVRQGV